MQKLIIADSQSALAAAVESALAPAIRAANGRMRTRTVDAADFAALVATSIAAQESGLALDAGASVPSSYDYKAYATTAGCAWAAITFAGTTRYVARIHATQVRANGNTRWAWQGGERVWTGLGVILGLSRGIVSNAGLTADDTRADLDQVIVQLGLRGAALTSEITEIATALAPQTAAA